MEYSILNKVAVRISVDSESVGSGIVFKNQDEIFVITAKHCIKNVNEELSIDFYESTNETFKITKLHKPDFEIIISSNNRIDVAIVKIINTQDEIWIDIPEIKIAANIFDLKKDFLFRGFPKAYNQAKPANIESTLVDESNEFFQIKPKDEKFDNSTIDYENNMEGFSGSGVVFSISGQIYLVGIISKFIGEILRFKVIELSFLRDLLSEVKIYNKEDIPFESTNIELLFDFKRQLNESENYIHNFKPQTALSELEKIENAINMSLLPKKDKDKLLAENNYLRGIALISLETPGESSELILKAYNFDSDVKKYKERAAAVYYLFNEDNKALELVSDILIQDPFNARAWSLKVQLITEDIDIPKIVLEKPRFLYNRFIYSLKGKEIPDVDDLRRSFGHISENIATPTIEEINFDNFLYYLFLAIYFLNDDNEKIKITSRKKLEKKVSTKEKKGAEILEVLSSKLIKTEVENTNLIQQAGFYYELSKYKMNPTKMNALRLTSLFMDNKLVSQVLMKAFDIIFILLDFDLDEEVIQVIEKSEIELYDLNFYIIRAESLEKLNRLEEAKFYYKRFVNEIRDVDAVKLQNLLISIDALQKYEIDNNLIHSYILNKTYLDEFAQSLLEGYIFRMNREMKDFSYSRAEQVFIYWNKLHFNYKMAVIAIYCGIGELEKGINLFRPLVSGNEELYLDQYIEILSLSKDNNKELLEKLEIWRLNFSSKIHFLLLEINLFRKIDNYYKIEEISKHGLDAFPQENRFKFFLIDILYKQRRISELKEYLNDTLLTFNLPSDNIFYLSRICLAANNIDLALELAYLQLKKNPLNNDIKMAYWSIVLKINEVYLSNSPEVVSFETVVELEIDGTNSLHEVAKDNYDSNPVIQAIFQKKIGDSVGFVAKFHNSNIKVIAIYNKYIGEFQKIIREINSPLSGGLPVTSMQFLDGNGEFNVEEFNKTLQNYYGKNAFREKIENDKIIREYKKRIIGFSQICNLLFDGNYFDCFETLTSTPMWGFNILPLNQQNKYKITKENEFVLDFTAILLFNHLSKKIEFKDFNLFISQSTKDLIVKQIYELELSSKERMDLSILPNQVIPIIYPENFLDNKLFKLKEILDWVEKNCKVDYVDFSLDSENIIERLSNEVERKYIEHTILISYKPNRILITDELLYYKNHMVNLMTTENFFKSISYQMWEIAKLQMIALNYKGLTLSRNTLYAVFEKSKFLIRNEQNLLHTAFQSLEGKHNPNTENIEEGIKFLKDIFSINLEQPLRLTVTKQIFISILKEPYFDISKENLKKIFNMIDKEFYLLGDSSEIVKSCLKDVLRNLKLIE